MRRLFVPTRLPELIARHFSPVTKTFLHPRLRWVNRSPGDSLRVAPLLPGNIDPKFALNKSGGNFGAGFNQVN